MGKKGKNRKDRLRAASKWISSYEGKNRVKGYSKKFGVDKLCAVKELEMLGIKISDKYKDDLKQDLINRQNQNRKRKEKKARQAEEALYVDSDATFAYIAGYTSGGAPYGVTWEEMDKEYDYQVYDIEPEDDEIPF